MNYKKIYDSLIERARCRTLECYVEIHHIIPKCMGGEDDKNNLVSLTPEEHYLAHQLLVKIYPNNHLLVYAAKSMIWNRSSNKMYGWLKRKFSIAKSIEQSGEGNSQYGTCWIIHDLFGAKRIKKELLVEYIEQGWFLGKKFKYVKSKKSKNKRIYVSQHKKNLDVETYRNYYKIYSRIGFDEFVKVTQYKYSKANLVQRFAKLLPEFVPQNGKKRK